METLLRLDPRSPSWPIAVDQVEAPPDALWVRGRLELLARPPGLAIVGSRATSPYGEVQARRFAAACAEVDLVVVSGLARGVDQAAHLGALDGGGDTIAVLGCGVDRPWPAGPAADRVAREGLLISEFLPGQGPRRHHFPLRNRLIAGLARAVLVVEAAHASGSLITARWALGQGKDVYALPGRVDNPLARGTHGLIREGAMPVASPEELFEDLLGRPASDHTAEDERLRPKHPLVAALVGETATAAELARRLVQPLPAVLAELAELELAGTIVRTPGGLYRLGAAP